jgi:hypothetical protein
VVLRSTDLAEPWREATFTLGPKSRDPTISLAAEADREWTPARICERMKNRDLMGPADLPRGMPPDRCSQAPKLGVLQKAFYLQI